MCLVSIALDILKGSKGMFNKLLFEISTMEVDFCIFCVLVFCYCKDNCKVFLLGRVRVLAFKGPYLLPVLLLSSIHVVE